LKRILPYFILLAFALQIGSRIYVLVDFQVNQAFIAENLCEKKDEPESCCEGSCHLSKELVKLEEEEAQSPVDPSQSKKEKVEEVVYFCNQNNKYVFAFKLTETLFLEQIHQPVKGFKAQPFHPPSV
jgi:hypothetical protein